MLYDNPQINKSIMSDEIIELIDSCSLHDMYIITDVIKAMKTTLEKHSDK